VYDELPHTGAGSMLLAVAALMMFSGGWLLRRVRRR
jgi:LPXTG-motif cell wall-anchored protein